ncbi:putative ABC transporter substrate binding component [Parascardovia denticolens DSM 10105 = JCM 12538]|uniref:transporter substrate-binding domain-containing protein n=1 Tax=Parascardovia denticolens TaxID=78258 RepID=UPI0001D093DF|nr:transporter substrate-binding domain-containing protein [Parascardovia denticolens]EFG32573.1 hypothetical protein HMPREF9017_01477 [Parascardovia denticolens F0305]BAR05077.1 putative ABC transporter substrate binding component [Parascardovia denticolens DSM 10105 = JCM 12538]
MSRHDDDSVHGRSRYYGHFGGRSHSRSHSYDRGLRRFLSRLLSPAFALISLVSLCALGGCGRTTLDVSGPKITIAIPYDQPGVSYRRTETMTGFNVFVATYLARQLGYSSSQISWVEATGANQDQLFSQEKVDLIVGARQGQGDPAKREFAGPYASSSQRILVRTSDKDRYRSLASLAGKTVCLPQGELRSDLVSQLGRQGTTVVSQATYSPCMTALYSGSADAVLGSQLVLAAYSRAAGRRLTTVTGPSLAEESYGVALPAGDRRLARLVDSSLVSMVKDPSFAQAVKTYERFAGMTVKKASVQEIQDTDLRFEADSRSPQVYGQDEDKEGKAGK